MSIIAKTDLTIELEKKLWKATKKLGLFACFEVTIGFGGKERVDYLTYDTKGIWRCYEIKTSKSDFYSKAAKTFIGHYNYYVMPDELTSQVVNDIPKHIGVHNGSYCVSRAKKQILGIDEQVLKNSMIRSLYRESEKVISSGDVTTIERLRNQLGRVERRANNNSREYTRLCNQLYKKYGDGWNEKLGID